MAMRYKGFIEQLLISYGWMAIELSLKDVYDQQIDQSRGSVVERLLSTPETRSLYFVIGKFYLLSTVLKLYWKYLKNENYPGNGPKWTPKYSNNHLLNNLWIEFVYNLKVLNWKTVKKRPPDQSFNTFPVKQIMRKFRCIFSVNLLTNYFKCAPHKYGQVKQYFP